MKTLVRACLVLAWLGCAGAASYLSLRGVETDVFQLLGARQDPFLAALADRNASSIRVLCADAARAEKCRAVFPFDAPPDPKAFLELVRTKGRGLLTEKARRELEAGETNRIARSALRRDYAGVGIFTRQEDPYYFLQDFLLSLRSFQPKVPSGAVLLTGDATKDTAGVDRLLALAKRDAGVSLSGAPFHARLATESARGEINLLGSISLVGVFLVGFWLFRSGRFVWPTLGALTAGFVTGAAALFVYSLPGRPHVLTLLFGTTLLGLGVDYCYHGLGDGGEAKTLRGNLLKALVTTTLAFLPLLFSSTDVLRQMAVFTIAGLVSIALAVLAFAAQGGRSVSSGKDLCSSPSLKIAVFLVSAAGLFWASFENDPSAFHRMDEVLARGERAVAEVTGAAKLRFRPVDLARWQRENAALKARMGVEPAGGYLSAADLPREMTVVLDGREVLLLPAAEGLDFATELRRLFERLAGETYLRLAVALGVMGVVLLIFFRRRVWSYLWPVGAALLATAGVLGWVGRPVNFFQLLCFFVLTGLGIDYVIFHREGGAKRTVFASFLTSFIGFGLLALTSFPVTRDMGLTMAVGLVFFYFFSLPRTREETLLWSRQKEVSAGAWRLMFMFGVYRLLGKGAVKALIVPVVVFSYPFAGAARRAILGFSRRVGRPVSAFRVMLNFAWSLIDKLDACSLKLDLPRMTLTGDASWREGGCFLLSTHVGTIEVLPALRQDRADTGAAKGRRVHAFQQMGHDRVFTSFFTRHLDPQQLTLHPTEEIGVETAVEMKEAIGRGEIVLMAADRPAASGAATVTRRFLGGDCRFPKGVFRFARLMEAPVYAVACVRTGWNAYEIVSARLGEDIEGGYVAFLEDLARRYPSQWFNFYDFFA